VSQGRDPLLSPVETSGNGWQRQLAGVGRAELHAFGTPQSLSQSVGQHKEMPSSLVRAIAQNLHGIRALDLQFDESRLVFSPSGKALWVVDGGGVTCMFREAIPASACDTQASVLRHGLFVETYELEGFRHPRPTNYWVQGLVPDGVGRVRAKVGSRVIDVHVRRNVYEIRAQRPIDVVVPSS
jgi:hypothetical protein